MNLRNTLKQLLGLKMTQGQDQDGRAQRRHSRISHTGLSNYVRGHPGKIHPESSITRTTATEFNVSRQELRDRLVSLDETEWMILFQRHLDAGATELTRPLIQSTAPRSDHTNLLCKRPLQHRGRPGKRQSRQLAPSRLRIHTSIEAENSDGRPILSDGELAVCSDPRGSGLPPMAAPRGAQQASNSALQQKRMSKGSHEPCDPEGSIYPETSLDGPASGIVPDSSYLAVEVLEVANARKLTFTKVKACQIRQITIAKVLRD